MQSRQPGVLTAPRNRAPKSDYQWTGTLLETDGDHLVVQKGNEKWEFLQDKDTKVTGDLKAGSGELLF